MEQGYRLGIDIGGTFTDAMVADADGRVVASLKTPSIPDAPEQAIFNALEQLQKASINIADIGLFVHGTTLGVNTLIERNGAVTGLLVTEGFRDVLEIRRLRLENTTNLYGDKALPLVPRRLVKEIDERCLASGEVFRSLNEQQLLQSVEELVQEGVTAIAISFLHSYKNAGHEQLAEQLIKQHYPELFVCTSSGVWPQQREYERTLATVMNAYVGSQMGGYFQRLEQGVQQYGLTAKVLSTMSNGGIMSSTRASSEPVKTLLSGPASGVIGATHVARMAGLNQVVTFDMGGTSVDVALIDGQPAYSVDNQVGDFPVIIPAIDVTAIGAGGGSIAWVDSAGVLKVGPRSVGARPGPACYNRGGTLPTTTDAYLHLGILQADRFLGGQMELRPDLAQAVLERLGEQLGMSSYEAAQAILDVATANMYAQFTPLMARKGVDPRDFTLLAYGGAGPMHAFLMAREVGIRKVLIPPSPGTLCAMGCVVADLRNDFVHSLNKVSDELQPGELAQWFEHLGEQGRRWITEETEQGIELDHMYLMYSADMRYEGQAFDLSVTLSSEAYGSIADAEARFHQQYEAVFGTSQPESPVAFVNLRATIIGVTRKSETVVVPAPVKTNYEAERRTIVFDGQEYQAFITDREQLNVGEMLSGPVIINEYDTTVFVPPGYSLTKDRFGNIIGEAEL
ncbi:hydantoinase/oxoprolinase family protein [Paenibacillus sp. NPDC056722]|uniref:hydantoinase/oxoprolinase family protein n=1 Tax=Paenibacillus sp. NPDC056722 TaxID=3345924 RepID=UPI0036A2A1FC